MSRIRRLAAWLALALGALAFYHGAGIVRRRWLRYYFPSGPSGGLPSLSQEPEPAPVQGSARPVEAPAVVPAVLVHQAGRRGSRAPSGRKAGVVPPVPRQ